MKEDSCRGRWDGSFLSTNFAVSRHLAGSESSSAPDFPLRLGDVSGISWDDLSQLVRAEKLRQVFPVLRMCPNVAST